MKNLKKAVALAGSLAEMGDNPKLSAEAFCQASLEAADGTSDARLDLIEENLGRPDYADAEALIRKLAEVIASGNTPAVPDPKRMSQFIGAYGGDAAMSQLAQMGASGRDAFAIAARRAARRHPERFGVIEDWDAFQESLSALTAQYDAALAAIDFSLADLIIDGGGLLPGERDRGLCRVTFKCTRGVVVFSDGWQQRLVDWHLRRSEKIAA